MNWHFKINTETDDIIEIGYSFEQNETCDGVIIYDKKLEEPRLEKLSFDSEEFIAIKGFQFIYSLIRRGLLTKEVYHIRTG